MLANKIYKNLEKNFIKTGLKDNWFVYMKEISDYISDDFKKRSMGLVCDFTKEINQVYTAVFPSRLVMKKILDNNVSEALLFVHHPSTWDIRKAPNIFQIMDKDLLEKFKKQKISIYNLHVPLDNFSKYSTSFTLAKNLSLKFVKIFGEYNGAMCGVIARSSFNSVSDLKKIFKEKLGHKVSLYNYGKDSIENNLVALIAGGGNDVELLKEIKKENINTFITGITVLNDHSRLAHNYAKENKINILGGSHYSTEKFACIEMIKYFNKLGLKAEFIEDKPLLADI